MNQNLQNEEGSTNDVQTNVENNSMSSDDDSSDDETVLRNDGYNLRPRPTPEVDRLVVSQISFL